MKLSFNNLYSSLSFQSLDTYTKKDKVIIAVVASVACGIFLFATYHAVCKIKNYFTHKPADNINDQDKKVSSVKDYFFNVQNDSVKIPSEVKKTLDQLFKNSPYQIDNLPIYPSVVGTQNHPSIKRAEMNAPVMKGIADGGRPFIAIKVDCNLRDENIKDYVESVRKSCKANPKLEDILVLYQSHLKGKLFWGGEGEYMWSQMPVGSLAPTFFTWNFTYPENGSGPTESQKENFKLVQTLLQTGQSPDVNGLIWSIAT